MAELSNADKRRAQITRNAARLFQEVGFNRTSVNDIAESLGMGKPTLYHYVKSKAEIVLAIHDEVYDMMMGEFQRRLKENQGPRELIRGLCHDIISSMETHPGYLRVYFEHHRELPPEVQANARRRRDRFQKLVEDAIEAGVQQGIFKTASVRLATLAVFGMCNWSYQWYRPGGPMTATETADFLFETFIRGLEVRPESGSGTSEQNGKRSASSRSAPATERKAAS